MVRSTLTRLASAGTYTGAAKVSLPRRPARKIRLGSARPAIYHEFDVLVELSDGSVIKRRSQYPRNEIRLIQDQRNTPLWNPSRTDLVVVDADAGGTIDRFKQKYKAMQVLDEVAESPITSKQQTTDKPVDSTQGVNVKGTDKSPDAEILAAKSSSDILTQSAAQSDGKVVSDQSELEDDPFGMNDYLSLLDDSSAQVVTGKLATKKRNKK